MRVAITAVCALFLLMLCVPQAHADDCTSGSNLVANCGFETGDFTGWTVSGNDVPGEEGNLYGVEGDDPFPLPGGTAPNSGDFQAFIADLDANPTTLSQDLATDPGGLYMVSFYMAQELVGPGDVNSSFIVTFGGSTVVNLTNIDVQGYTLYTGLFTATGTSTALDITGGNDIGEFLVDDVSVKGVPEPSSLSLMLLGIAMLGFSLKKSRLCR
ncbi:MAG: PEP-CTERM sorting domain-containing protein [Candidatus Acidiferrales bacterium]